MSILCLLHITPYTLCHTSFHAIYPIYDVRLYACEERSGGAHVERDALDVLLRGAALELRVGADDHP